jgi:hypothetical protein
VTSGHHHTAGWTEEKAESLIAGFSSVSFLSLHRNTMKKQNQQRRSLPALFETLEGRQLLSATVKPATAIATTTSLTVSSRSIELGQTLTVKGVVTSSAGVPRGTVELLDGNTDTGLTGTLNHKGYYVFTLDAGSAPYVGTQEYRIRYLSAGSFVGSKSRQLVTKVKGPSLTTESDGLELGTVTAGTGTATAKSGDSLTVQYTGFNLTGGGTPFDDSAAHSPGTFTFTVDSTTDPVITGFDEEATGMKVGETRVAIIPEALAYPTGSGSSLAGDTLVFVLHVVSIA